MKLKKLLKELERLNLPINEFAITSSGPLAVRGLREARDLDIICSDKLWEKLSKKYPVIKGNINDRITIGNIDFLGNFRRSPKEMIATTKEQIESADVIDGYRYVNLKLTKIFKEKRGKEKDLIDIKLIDDYLSKKFK